MELCKNIINEIDVVIHYKKYKEITLEGGEKILERYDAKYKMWVQLSFSKEDDSKVIKNFISVAKKVFQ